jgi:hypothetical protein
MKKKKVSRMEHDDEGIDVDTFEANYIPDYEDEEEESKG